MNGTPKSLIASRQASGSAAAAPLFGGVWGNVRDNHPGFFDQMIKRNPTGRMASPEEIAAATVFLASPRSAFTTGINMLVDGALSRRVNF